MALDNMKTKIIIGVIITVLILVVVFLVTLLIWSNQENKDLNTQVKQLHQMLEESTLERDNLIADTHNLKNANIELQSTVLTLINIANSQTKTIAKLSSPPIVTTVVRPTVHTLRIERYPLIFKDTIGCIKNFYFIREADTVQPAPTPDRKKEREERREKWLLRIWHLIFR